VRLYRGCSGQVGREGVGGEGFGIEFDQAVEGEVHGGELSAGAIDEAGGGGDFAAVLFDDVDGLHEATKDKQRHFVRLEYAAKSWDRARTVIAKAEPTAKGGQPAFHPHQLGGRGTEDLRRDLLRGRRDGEPDQGAFPHRGIYWNK